MGDIDNDGDYDKLYSFGTRSFTIWDGGMNLVYDSGATFEKLTAVRYKNSYFNTSNSKLKFDDRSPKKGPEPEGVATALIDGAWYAFIGLERIGGIMVYNVSDVKQPRFIQYINNRNFKAEVNKKKGSMLTLKKPETSDLKGYCLSTERTALLKSQCSQLLTK